MSETMTNEELDRLDSEAVELVKTSDNIGAVLVAGQIRRLITEIHKRDKRVEELEKESEWKAMKQLLGADYHVITDEQIDAAWKLAELYPNWHGPVEQALSRIGVNRCPVVGCDGRGVFLYGDHSEGWERSQCEGCHGHGWVVKDE